MTEHSRPAKRSTPVSRILQNKDTNVSLTAPSSNKKKLYSFLQGTPLKKHKTLQSEESSIEARKITQLATPSQKFKIHRDRSTPVKAQLKTPISELKNTTSWRPAEDHTKTPTSKKITRQTIDQNFKLHEQTSLPFTFITQQHADSPLLHEVEMPIVRLDQWYKIHQMEILTRDAVEYAHTVLEVNPFNELLTLVKVENAKGSMDEVLLLNYKQSVVSLTRFKNVKKGDKISLIEGFDIFGERKMYHNWKLQG